ncbi:uncharacterized protein BXZ73DRAFT_99982 [Epithele typhae]|uniref:uncharacterized protein n=1 Tax=Epithele typhae TaxID=378194 RepID=UPI0020077964|nr:uncharacterized protein BXZ73DRAFT_99982 [Epithele typhae]KAH9937761.1 hypothetical protein BXZ73DRAFT_99982 [Epithele typhae]
MGSQPTLQNKWAVVGGALGLMTYDHMLSIGREVEYVWRKKMTTAGGIYIAIRYASMTSNLLMCAGITVAFDLMGAIIIMGAASFSSLRAYALCQRKYIAIIVLVLGCMNAVPSIYAAIRNRAGYNPGPNNLRTVCDLQLITSFYSAIIFGRSCGVIGDFIVLVLTWRHAGPRKGGPKRFSITTALFQNGLAYFGALCFVNLLNLVLVNHVELLLNLLGIISTTTVVFTCRFILDLFEASDGTRMDTVPTLPSMAPSRAVGLRNVGAVSTTGRSQGVFDADLTLRGADDCESVCDNKPDFDAYELQMNPGRK